jgi:hypothetical protein
MADALSAGLNSMASSPRQPGAPVARVALDDDAAGLEGHELERASADSVAPAAHRLRRDLTIAVGRRSEAPG